MKPNEKPSASSSDDLERARALSRALSTRGGSAPPSPGPGPQAAAPGYVSFGPRTGWPGRVAPPPVAVPAPAPPPRRDFAPAPTLAFGAAAWNAFLDACMAVAHAELAFVMEPQGLVVAARGGSAESMEESGARLLVAMGHADMADGEQVLSMSLERANGTVFGLRLLQSDGTFLLLGLSAKEGLPPDRVAKLQALVREARPAKG